MSKLNTEERKKLPAEDFGDPGRRLFPIVDQNDVESAAHLIGKAKDPDAVKARIVAIAKRKGLSLPDAWKGDTADHAYFDAGALFGRRVEGDHAIYDNSLLFKAGDYPDKAFAMTPEELLKAASEWPPVRGNVQHTKFLAGRAGEITRAWLDDDGETLRGEVKVPLWLDERLTDGERKLSLEWDRTTKRPTGFGLVTNPRVSEAALMSAAVEHQAVSLQDLLTAVFEGKRHDTPEGQAFLQNVHDQAARAGAKCDRSNVRMHSSHEMTAIQAIHDAAAEHGAKCSGLSPEGRTATPGVRGLMPLGSGLPPTYVGYSATDEKPGNGQEQRMDQNQNPSILDQIKALLGMSPGPTPTPPAQLSTGQPPIPSPSPDAAFAALQAENARLKQAQEAAFSTNAATFAAQATKAGHILPAQAERVALLHAQLSRLDAETAQTVTFSDGHTERLSELFTRIVLDSTKHRLTENTVGGGFPESAFAVFAGAREGGERDEFDIAAFTDRMAGARGGSLPNAHGIGNGGANISNGSNGNGAGRGGDN